VSSLSVDVRGRVRQIEIVVDFIMNLVWDLIRRVHGVELDVKLFDVQLLALVGQLLDSVSVLILRILVILELLFVLVLFILMLLLLLLEGSLTLLCACLILSDCHLTLMLQNRDSITPAANIIDTELDCLAHPAEDAP